MSTPTPQQRMQTWEPHKPHCTFEGTFSNTPVSEQVCSCGASERNRTRELRAEVDRLSVENAQLRSTIEAVTEAVRPNGRTVQRRMLAALDALAAGVGVDDRREVTGQFVGDCCVPEPGACSCICHHPEFGLHVSHVAPCCHGRGDRRG